MPPKNNLNRVKQSQAAKALNLSEWRKSRLQEIILPSGLTVTVRDVSMTDLMFSGKLPDSMLDMAQGAAEQGAQDLDLKSLVKNGNDFNQLINELVKLCVIEPPIAEMPDDEHLGINELNGDDKMFIFNWANREVEKLRPFRDGETEPPAAV
jgi:hypothetical protein